MKLIFRLEQFTKGFYLKKWNKPNSKGLKGHFRKIENDKQMEKENIRNEIKKIAEIRTD